MTGIVLLVLRIAMTVALYAFLGWVLLLMWRTLKREASLLSARTATPLTLALEGPEAGDQTFHFTSSDVLVGRDPDCECMLTDATISARHVRFTYHHSQWWVEDLGSRNGTGLNGALLKTATIVVNGDSIKCGQTILRVILEGESAPKELHTPDMEIDI